MLKNKKALVTGGTRGIGRAIVLDLAANGCDVVFTYHSSDKAAKELESESKKYGVQILSFKADASNLKEAEKSVQFTLENFGNLDFLVNNAGITKDNLILRMSEEDFDSVISSNLKSVYNYSKLSIRPMMKQRYGRIINIASVVALIGNPGQANYVASKAGVIGLTKSLAREFASRNITVNAVAPGYVSTDMTKDLNDAQKEAILNQVPLKRIAEPKDIAKVVTFLASSAADYITGQVIAVDGGMTM